MSSSYVTCYNFAQSRPISKPSSACDDAIVFQDRWRLSKLLYRQLQLRNSWRYDPPIEEDIEEERIRARVQPKSAAFVTDIDFSPEGRFLVGGCADGSVPIFISSSGKLLHRTDTITSEMSTTAAASEGEGAGGIGTNHPATVKSAVMRVRFIGEHQFVTGSASGIVALWDVRKPGVCVNRLLGHGGSAIRSLDFDPESDCIISASHDGQVRFWYRPAFQVRTEHQDSDEQFCAFRGVLLDCPRFNQACLSKGTRSSTRKLVICTENTGNMFLIDNFDLRNLKNDLKLLRFDDTIKLRLSWFSPSNASPFHRNRVSMLECEDYCPQREASVSAVSCIVFHPFLPVLLIRLTTTRRNLYSREVKDWTCISTVKVPLSDDHHTKSKSELQSLMKGFGSNIVEGETLLFVAEEERYAPFREKRVCFSNCGRLVASPNKTGVRLLGFSEDLHLLNSVEQRSSFSLWSFGSLSHSNFVPIYTVEGNQSSPTLCCQFSPVDILLATGDLNGHISFYQPKI